MTDISEREVLAKLVANKNVEERLKRLHEMGHGTDYDQHRRQFAAAWDQARALLAGSADKALMERAHKLLLRYANFSDLEAAALEADIRERLQGRQK